MSANRILLSFLVAGAWACKGSPPPAPPVAANAPAQPAAQPAEKPAPAGPPVTFGVAMTLGVQQAQQAPQLISDYFSKALGRPVEVRLFTSDELADALAQGTVDVAYMPPLAYVKALKSGPLQAIRRAVHHGSPSYVSVLFVRNDSPIKSIENMAKKKVAWVQEGSASGNLIPRAMLMKRDIDPEKYFSEQLFLQDHSKVCDAVYSKRVDVGASFADLLPPELEAAQAAAEKSEKGTGLPDGPNGGPEDVRAVMAAAAADGGAAGAKPAMAEGPNGGHGDVKPAMAGGNAAAPKTEPAPVPPASGLIPPKDGTDKISNEGVPAPKVKMQDLLVEGCRAALGEDKLKELRVVYTSEPMPNDIVALKRGTPPDLVAKLTAAIDSMGPTADGQTVMRDAFHADGFINAVPSDFSALQTLVNMYPEPKPK